MAADTTTQSVHEILITTPADWDPAERRTIGPAATMVVLLRVGHYWTLVASSDRETAWDGTDVLFKDRCRRA